MDLRKEQEYIAKFFEELTDEEFVTMLEECGNSTILPTQEIHHHLLTEGFYDRDCKYALKTSYQVSKKLKTYEKYDNRCLKVGQGEAA